MSKAARKTRRRDRTLDSGPVLSMTVAEFFALRLSQPQDRTPTTYQEYLRYALCK